MAKQCLKIRVEGRVQGVFFRKQTQQRAVQLGLTGYAKNLQDGAVEVIACGEDAALEQLASFVRQGPPGSQVFSSDTLIFDYQSYSGFEIL
ncbi:acylphosphatase [Bowmanella yangjiangensis]|uniref:Acylphosphatase n=1 Tax=Bowmanella yangjiangensis TaxID=2811230 RepID=A0ABS3CYA2_9ALTE|nr:acylphosphatase [Bowmanella yangjiangensis]MBN7822107.1 acylphosphatase [Bowmanella yangjiangensis]